MFTSTGSRDGTNTVSVGLVSVCAPLYSIFDQVVIGRVVVAGSDTTLGDKGYRTEFSRTQ